MIEVAGEPVRAGHDDLPYGFADQGLSVADEAAGEVVAAVLGGEVAFIDSRCVRMDSELRRGVA